MKQEQDKQDHTWQDKQEEFLYNTITRMILKNCFEVMNTLGCGFLESIYRNALVIALTDSGLKVLTDRGFEVSFHGRNIGTFIPDIIVEEQVIVELKSCERLIGEHEPISGSLTRSKRQDFLAEHSVFYSLKRNRIYMITRGRMSRMMHPCVFQFSLPKIYQQPDWQLCYCQIVD